MGGAKRILVLGASGFLGAHVVARLVHARNGGGAVVAVRSGLGPAHGFALGGALEWRELDLRAEPGQLEGLLERVAPDAVVNAAALARGDACDRDPRAAFRLNAQVPRELAAWCAARAVRLIHVSTDLVFGGAPPHDGGYRESDAPAPLSIYGRSKAEGEALVLAAYPAALVLRLPLLFGDSGGRALGASDGLLGAWHAGNNPALFDDELRTPLCVSDAALALVQLLPRPVRGLLHVAGPERLSRLEFGLRVLRAAGISEARARAGIRVKTRAAAGLAATRPADVSLDSSRARALLACELRRPAVALSDPVVLDPPSAAR